MVTLRGRIFGAFAVLLVLAIGGEFLGAVRRRTLRREVPYVKPPTLLAGQVGVRVMGPDGLPVPQGAATVITTYRVGSRIAALRHNMGFSAGSMVLAAPDAPGRERWLEVCRVSDYADEPLPFGAVLLGPLPEGTATLDVVLPPEEVIAGSVRDDGGPVQGVRVRARRVYPKEIEGLPGLGAETYVDEAMTGPDGLFRIRRLGPGLHVVDFVSPLGMGIAGRRIESGRPLDIHLAGDAAPTVSLVDAEGRPIGNSAIRVVDQGGEVQVTGTSDWNGRFRVTGLDPARTYRLVVVRPGAPPDGPGEERDWRPADVTITPGPRR